MNANATDTQPGVHFLMMGPFPPPVHGLAVVNEAVRRRLSDCAVPCRIADVSARSLDRTYLARISRLPRVLRKLLWLLAQPAGRTRVFYTSVSGGPGKIYEIAAVGIARLQGSAVVLHHHSFRYIDRYSVLMHCLAIVAGRRAKHVALSRRMSNVLGKRYRVQDLSVISNAVFSQADFEAGSGATRDRLCVIGFLGNLSLAKGVREFLDVVETLEARHVRVRALMAGPFEDPETGRMVNSRLAELTAVEYLGPVYGKDKTAFFKNVDAILFPTRYTNEAEPVVIHEALAHAIPVIAFGRGAIPEIVTPKCGLVVDPAADFETVAVNQIERWLDSPGEYLSASAAARKRYEHMRGQGEGAWERLLSRLTGRSVR